MLALVISNVPLVSPSGRPGVLARLRAGLSYAASCGSQSSGLVTPGRPPRHASLAGLVGRAGRFDRRADAAADRAGHRGREGVAYLAVARCLASPDQPVPREALQSGPPPQRQPRNLVPGVPGPRRHLGPRLSA